MSERSLWIGSIVIDCNDLPRMISFWQAVLHYVPRGSPDEDGAVLKDPAGAGPNVSLNRTAEGPVNDYRLHLDLYSSDPKREVERIVGLGAKISRDEVEGEDFVTLADPEGNLFDVIDKRGWSFGRRA